MEKLTGPAVGKLKTQGRDSMKAWEPAETQMFKFQLEKAGEPETASYPFYHLFKYKKQNANIRWIIEKSREFQKNIYSCFIDYAKAFDYVHCNKLENS